MYASACVSACLHYCLSYYIFGRQIWIRNIPSPIFNYVFCITKRVKSHLLTISASTLRSVPACQPHANVFGLPPSQSSSGFWPYPLSPGLAISALVCLDFAFHLLSSVISFSCHHLYPAPAHVQSISTSSLWGILSTVTCVPLSRCSHFSHDLGAYFVLPVTTCAFQLCPLLLLSNCPTFCSIHHGRFL